MATQRVFTFHSPVEQKKMVEIIDKAVSALGGKTKASGNVVTAKWWCKGTTTFRHKYEFFVGKEAVRVTSKDLQSTYHKTIKWELGFSSAVVKLWNEFVRVLTQMYPDLDFGLEQGKPYMVSAKLMSNGVEQVFSSTSVSKPSIGGALIGGALFGGVGAIVGGSRSKTRTTGSTRTVFSSTVLATVRYSNGLNLEGNISRKSDIYNKIQVGLCEVTEK